ncbi:MAG: metalloregulator ArsR/SmtB family transcription factor [Verrucomicrobiales bacterium]|nr:metalloregulator ArsR/SmtB family transcription factor [Verrucomicrobiales bacterium]
MEATTELMTRPGCAELLKALGDETRLLVVKHLLEESLHVGELKKKIGIEQSLLSHHLRLLRDAGIVESERDGKAVLYRLATRVEEYRNGRTLDLGCCELTFPSSTCC